MIETAYELVTGITINDSDVTENREVPLIEVCRYVLIQFSSERLSEYRSFESRDILDQRLELNGILGGAK